MINTPDLDLDLGHDLRGEFVTGPWENLDAEHELEGEPMAEWLSMAVKHYGDTAKMARELVRHVDAEGFFDGAAKWLRYAVGRAAGLSGVRADAAFSVLRQHRLVELVERGDSREQRPARYLLMIPGGAR